MARRADRASLRVAAGAGWALLGGAIAARFACERPDQLSRLVLVDSFGLSWNRPSARFALPLLAYIARPTERTRDRFLAQCFVDFDGLRDQMAERFEPFGAYSLEWARTKRAKAALRSLMPEYGMRPIPRDVLARIEVPTALIGGVMTSRRGSLWPRVRARVTAGRCT